MLLQFKNSFIPNTSTLKISSLLVQNGVVPSPYAIFSAPQRAVSHPENLRNGITFREKFDFCNSQHLPNPTPSKPFSYQKIPPPNSPFSLRCLLQTILFSR